MGNIIAVIILICAAGAAVRYLYRAKKSGKTCIGCPYSKECSGRCGGRSGQDSTARDSHGSDSKDSY